MLKATIDFFHSLSADADMRQRAQRVYIALVEAARNPFFYARCGVPDTLDGRFDLILLHLFIVLNRLKEDGIFTRAVTEAYINDMDRSLREIGVGDMGVSRRIKQMGNAFNGRVQAYEAALADTDPQALEAAIARNVYGTATNPPAETHLQTLTKYTRHALKVFGRIPFEEIYKGNGWADVSALHSA